MLSPLSSLQFPVLELSSVPSGGESFGARVCCELAMRLSVSLLNFVESFLPNLKNEGTSDTSLD